MRMEGLPIVENDRPDAPVPPQMNLAQDWSDSEDEIPNEILQLQEDFLMFGDDDDHASVSSWPDMDGWDDIVGVPPPPKAEDQAPIVSTSIFSLCNASGLVCAAAAKKVTFCHKDDAKIFHRIVCHQEDIAGVAFSDDGCLVATASADMVLVNSIGRDAETNDWEIHPYWTSTQKTSTSVVWQPDSHILVACATDVFMWHIELDDKKILKAPTGVRAMTAGFSICGRRLLVVYDTGMSIMWSVESLSPLLWMCRPEEPIAAHALRKVLCSQADSTFLVAGLNEKVVIIDDFGPKCALDVGNRQITAVALANDLAYPYLAIGLKDAKFIIYRYTAPYYKAEYFTTDGWGVTQLEFLNKYVLVVATERGSIFGFSMEDREVRFTIPVVLGFPVTFAYDSIKQTLITCTDPESVDFLNLRSLSQGLE